MFAESQTEYVRLVTEVTIQVLMELRRRQVSPPKPTVDCLPPPVISSTTNTFLNESQKQLLWAYHDDAVRGAYAAAEMFGDAGRQVMNAGELETVALEAWARTILAGKVDPSRNPKSFAFGAGRYAALSHIRRSQDNGLYIVTDMRAPEPGEPSPADDDGWERVVRDALAVTGGQPPTEHAGWVEVGLSLGLSRRVVFSASKVELPKLVIRTIRQRLGEKPLVQSREQEVQPPAPSPADPVPAVVRARMAQPAPVSNRAQARAERFIRVWTASRSPRAAAEQLGWSVGKTTRYARMLRRIGVTELKTFPSGRRRAIHGILKIRPSAN